VGRSQSRWNGSRRLRCSLRSSGPHRQPSHACEHPAPAEQADHGSDSGVIVQDSEARKYGVKIVLDKIGIPGRHQRKCLVSSVGHVRRGVQPVLKKEEKTEHETEGLALRKEIGCQKKRDQPLQEGSAPEAECGTKPSEQVVSALVNNQVGIVNKQSGSVGGKCIGQKRKIKDGPTRNRRAGDRPPRFLENGLETFKHRPAVILKINDGPKRLRTFVRRGVCCFLLE